MEKAGRSLMRKDDIVRSRGDYPGEAGADWEFGTALKPEADEHYVRRRAEGGLRGKDMQQGDHRDRSSNMREPLQGEPAETQSSPHQAEQHGADVRGNPPMMQGTNRIDSLPEGLRRERKGPYDENLGRAEEATQVPKNWTGKQ
jgi:hypothetical protein